MIRNIEKMSGNKISSYNDLIVWQKSMSLVKLIYGLKSFPESEKYSLVSQTRRASISIASNIAEGWGRGHNKYFSHFLNISKGSLFELETQVMISHDLNYISNTESDQILGLTDEISRMISGLPRSLKSYDSSNKANEPLSDYELPSLKNYELRTKNS